VIWEIVLLLKAEPSIIGSEAGGQIDSNDEQNESAFDSIRDNSDPDSNVKDGCGVQYEKEQAARNSAEAGDKLSLMMTQVYCFP
jgi:hypothetical protein